jgi:tRNA-Thr(GGU) m(6)t(6)A37 methyltransferase TsaA
MEQVVKFIGTIHSALKSLGDCPLQGNENAPDAELAIYSEYSEGARDIVVGSEILLFTWLHMADRNVIVCKPRHNDKNPMTGIFSTRSPNRPNPIGIHTVKVLSISDSGLIRVSGLEVIDQTPLIDIKPVWNK